MAYYPATSFVHPELQKGGNLENPRRLIPIIGGPLEERREIARKLSPVELLSRESPPLWLVHGEQDTAVSHQHSIFLCERAKEKGASAECLIVHGAAHGLRGEAIDPPADEICRRTVDFIFGHLTE